VWACLLSKIIYDSIHLYYDMFPLTLEKVKLSQVSSLEAAAVIPSTVSSIMFYFQPTTYFSHGKFIVMYFHQAFISISIQNAQLHRICGSQAEWLRQRTRDIGVRCSISGTSHVFKALGKLWIHMASGHPAVMGTWWIKTWLLWNVNGISCWK
jgi:hypothetical protein